MNMLVRNWPLLEDAPPVVRRSRVRLVSAIVAVAAHAVLGLALLFNRAAEHLGPLPPPQPIMVDVLPAAPKHAVMMSGIRQIAPEVPVIPMPDFALQAPPTHTITVQPPGSASASAPVAFGTEREAYFARLVAYLESRKRYPAEARRWHIEGVVQVIFRIDRLGRVLDYAISGSSGRTILDDEAKALIARAQPLPPIPPDWPERELSFAVPIEFRLH